MIISGLYNIWILVFIEVEDKGEDIILECVNVCTREKGRLFVCVCVYVYISSWSLQLKLSKCPICVTFSQLNALVFIPSVFWWRQYTMHPGIPDYNRGLKQNQIPCAATKTLKKKKKLSGLIFIEMSIDTPFRLWHQRVECHIFCRWDWASARGLVANTIEECKHSEGRERPINACSLGLINYLKKETEVWGHQRNLIRTRFITPSLHPQPLPAPPHTVVSSSALLHLLIPTVWCKSSADTLTSHRGQRDYIGSHHLYPRSSRTSGRYLKRNITFVMFIWGQKLPQEHRVERFAF